jgi:RNA polymerase sigma factor (TIGR02999 family)
MSDVTQILSQIDQGDPHAAAQLLPLVYDELRKLAAAKLGPENPGHTLQPTALVHEAFMRLVAVEPAQHWDSTGHFFAAAAEAMRRILIDTARRKQTLRRGRSAKRIPLTHLEPCAEVPDEALLDLDEALTRLQQIDPAKAELVKLRYFGGLTISQAAQVLGVSVTTANRHWAYARAWLHAELEADGDPGVR